MPDPSEADIERFVRTDGPARYSPAHLSAWAALSCTCLPMMKAAPRGVSRSSRTHGRYPEISGELFAVNPRPMKE
jgi:hypothetical protein